eukprot:COSAG02_NODE_35429_length_468_cov_1.146341_1_plen_48_part_10
MIGIKMASPASNSAKAMKRIFLVRITPPHAASAEVRRDAGVHRDAARP